MLICKETHDDNLWNQYVDAWLGHPMQSWSWGELKAATGPWVAHRVLLFEGENPVGGAQILVRKLPWPFGAIAYAPRGPMSASQDRLPEVADACAEWCAEHAKAVSLKIDPAVQQLDLSSDWKPSEHVLLASTATIDLTPEEDDIFKGLHSKKARQYIRKAGRDGVTCRPAVKEDLDGILSIYKRTAANDGFPLHADEFYHKAFDMLGDENQLFVAEKDGTMLSFLWNATTAGTAFELWGGVSDEGKRLRANYLLKWTAIQAAKARGTKLYDLNGLLNDGISDFKLLFVEDPTQWVGSFDKPLSAKYHLWDCALKIRRALRK